MSQGRNIHTLTHSHKIFLGGLGIENSIWTRSRTSTLDGALEQWGNWAGWWANTNAGTDSSEITHVVITRGLVSTAHYVSVTFFLQIISIWKTE